MTDPNHELDELLRNTARDYNRPGEAPRDRMWESIRAERARRTPARPPTAWRRAAVRGLAAAAVLVLGIVIGRTYEHMTAGTTAPAKLAVRLPVDSGSPPAPNGPVEAPPVIAKAPDGKANHTPRARPEAPTVVTAPGAGESESHGDNSNLAFRLAVVQHLAGTEAMLTSFRAEAASGDVDAQVTSWARNLLTTTRVLEAAAPQQDPTMKRLLGDLELVLIQIAQYSPTNPHRAEELELIEHSIKQRGVIDKLRTTIPARLVPSGT